MAGGQLYFSILLYNFYELIEEAGKQEIYKLALAMIRTKAIYSNINKHHRF